MRAAADFTALRREGKRLASPSFQAQYRLTEGSHASLGMAVSRRVSKLAVIRNRIRRTIRESFRLNRGGLPDCHVLLIARTDAAARSPKELRGDLDSIWQRLAALKPRDATRTIPPRS